MILFQYFSGLKSILPDWDRDHSIRFLMRSTAFCEEVPDNIGGILRYRHNLSASSVRPRMSLNPKMLLNGLFKSCAMIEEKFIFGCIEFAQTCFAVHLTRGVHGLNTLG